MIDPTEEGDETRDTEPAPAPPPAERPAIPPPPLLDDYVDDPWAGALVVPSER